MVSFISHMYETLLMGMESFYSCEHALNISIPLPRNEKNCLQQFINVVKGEFPWQVLVRESTWLGLFTKNKCGGVLISNSYVLTAGMNIQCFIRNFIFPLLSPPSSSSTLHLLLFLPFHRRHLINIFTKLQFSIFIHSRVSCLILYL